MQYCILFIIAATFSELKVDLYAQTYICNNIRACVSVIRFDGAEANDLTPSELRRRLTFVIQRGVRRGQIDVFNENTQEAAKVNNESDLKTKLFDLKHPKVDVSQTSQLAYNLDDEIEILLNQAQLSIEVDEALKNESMSSSLSEADQLLLEAEESIGQSFRTKVFHFVKNSFKDIKTGVALNK